MSKSKSILIVEDNLDMLSGLQLALELEGYSVQVAPDGVQALELLTTSVPDLILIDLKMPHMDGLTLLTKTRQSEAWRDIPVIVVTAVAEPKIELDVKARGALAYITKPFELDALLDTVTQILSNQ